MTVIFPIFHETGKCNIFEMNCDSIVKSQTLSFYIPYYVLCLHADSRILLHLITHKDIKPVRSPWISDQTVALPTPGRIRTRNPSKRKASVPCLIPPGHRDRINPTYSSKIVTFALNKQMRQKQLGIT